MPIVSLALDCPAGAAAQVESLDVAERVEIPVWLEELAWARGPGEILAWAAALVVIRDGTAAMVDIAEAQVGTRVVAVALAAIQDGTAAVPGYACHW